MEGAVFTPTDFQSLIKELKSHITQELKGLHVVDKPMCAKEAAKFLGVSTSTLYDRIRKSELPDTLIHRIGGSVYFLPSELHQFIKRS